MATTRTHRSLSISSALLGAVLVIALAAPAGASTSRTGSGDDQQVAEDSTLTIDDIDAVVGSGFTEQTPDDSEQSFDAPSCTAIRKASKLVKKGAHAETEFGAEAGDAFANINNIVGVLSSTKRAKAVYAAYAAPKAADCLEEAFTEAVEAQNPDASPTVTVRESEPDAGDAAVGYEGEVSAGTNGGFFFEIVFVRVGRAISGFYFVNSSSAPPSDDTAQLVEDGVARLTDELAA